MPQSSWMPLSAGCTKINVDASPVEVNFRGSGVAARDDQANLLASADSKVMGNWDVETMKACTAHLAL